MTQLSVDFPDVGPGNRFDEGNALWLLMGRQGLRNKGDQLFLIEGALPSESQLLTWLSAPPFGSRRCYDLFQCFTTVGISCNFEECP